MCVLIIFLATLSNCWDSTFMYMYNAIYMQNITISHVFV